MLNNNPGGTANSTNSSSLSGGGNNATSTVGGSNNSTNNSTASDNDTLSPKISAGDTVETQNDTNASRGVKIGNSGDLSGQNGSKTLATPVSNTNTSYTTTNAASVIKVYDNDGTSKTTNAASVSKVHDNDGTSKTNNTQNTIYNGNGIEDFETSTDNGIVETSNAIKGNEPLVRDQPAQNTIQNFTTDIPKYINRTYEKASQTGHTRSSDEHMFSYRNTGVTDSSFNNEYDRSGRTKSHTDKMIIDADELSDNYEGEDTTENIEIYSIISDDLTNNLRSRTTSRDLSHTSDIYIYVKRNNVINEELEDRGITEDNEITTYNPITDNKLTFLNSADQIHEATTSDPNDVDKVGFKITTDTIQSLVETSEDYMLDIRTEMPHELTSKEMFDSNANAVHTANNVNNQSQTPDSNIETEVRVTTKSEPNTRSNEFQKDEDQDSIHISGIDDGATHMLNTLKLVSTITRDELDHTEFDVSIQPTKMGRRSSRSSTDTGQEKTDIMTENGVTIDPRNIRLSKSIDHTEEPTGELTKVTDRYDVDTSSRNNENDPEKFRGDSNKSVTINKNADVSKTTNIMELFGFRSLAHTAETTTIGVLSSNNNVVSFGNISSSGNGVNDEITNNTTSNHGSKLSSDSKSVLTSAQKGTNSNKTVDESLGVHEKGVAEFVSSTIKTTVENIDKPIKPLSTTVTIRSDVLHKKANETIGEVGDEDDSDQNTLITNDTNTTVNRDGSSAHLVESAPIHNDTAGVSVQDSLIELSKTESVHNQTGKENEVFDQEKGNPSISSKLLHIRFCFTITFTSFT